MNKVKVIKFSAPWCSHCKPLKKIFEDIQEQNKSFELVLVDIDQDEETTSKYSIRSLPTIVFLKNDVEIHRMAGSQTKSVIENKISELLA